MKNKQFDIFKLKSKFFGNVVKFDNNLAYQSDFNITISKVIEGYKNGLYDLEGLKLGLNNFTQEDYIAMETSKGEHTKLKINTSLLHNFAKFCGKDNYRPIFHNVCIRNNKICATNANYLKFENFDFGGDVLIPKDVIKLLPKNEEVEIYIFENIVEIYLKDYKVSYKLLEDKFPDIEQVIPKEFEDGLKFDVKEINFEKHKYCGNVLDILQTNGVLKFRSEYLSTDQEYEHSCEHIGEYFHIKVDIDSLKLCLEDCKEVNIKRYRQCLMINDNIVLMSMSTI